MDEYWKYTETILKLAQICVSLMIRQGAFQFFNIATVLIIAIIDESEVIFYFFQSFFDCCQCPSSSSSRYSTTSYLMALLRSGSAHAVSVIYRSRCVL